MNFLREAAQQALEAMEKTHTQPGCEQWQAERKASVALRAALAQEEQERKPVAHLWQHSETGRTRVVMPDQVVTADATWLVVGPLYLHPPRRAALAQEEQEPVAWLRRDELADLQTVLRAIRAIEQALKEKNHE
jgi:hypothetical protein